MQHVFVGKVGDGYGSAASDVASGSYSALSTNLYPGTLNVYTEDSPWKLPLPPKTLIQHHGAKCLIWDAVLQLPDGESTKVWAMWPQHVVVFTWNVLEILSEQPLRSTYKLFNGDEVRVII